MPGKGDIVHVGPQWTPPGHGSHAIHRPTECWNKRPACSWLVTFKQLKPFSGGRFVEAAGLSNHVEGACMTALNSPVARRQVLKGFLIAGPTLAIGARLGFADGANAWPTKTDETPDVQDFTDIFVASQQPTLYDLKIEIKPDNRVYAEGPRQDIGQG